MQPCRSSTPIKHGRRKKKAGAISSFHINKKILKMTWMAYRGKKLHRDGIDEIR
jgi:hypothetical protein